MNEEMLYTYLSLREDVNLAARHLNCHMTSSALALLARCHASLAEELISAI